MGAPCSHRQILALIAYHHTKTLRRPVEWFGDIVRIRRRFGSGQEVRTCDQQPHGLRLSKQHSHAPEKWCRVFVFVRRSPTACSHALIQAPYDIATVPQQFNSIWLSPCKKVPNFLPRSLVKPVIIIPEHRSSLGGAMQWSWFCNRLILTELRLCSRHRHWLSVVYKSCPIGLWPCFCYLDFWPKIVARFSTH